MEINQPMFNTQNSVKEFQAIQQKYQQHVWFFFFIQRENIFFVDIKLNQRKAMDVDLFITPMFLPINCFPAFFSLSISFLSLSFHF